MYKIILLEETKAGLGFWIKNDKQMVKRIKTLLENISINPESGIGKPEKLKHKFSGYFSRRINSEHRLIYKILEEKKEVIIISCRGDYKS